MSKFLFKKKKKSLKQEFTEKYFNLNSIFISGWAAEHFKIRKQIIKNKQKKKNSVWMNSGEKKMVLA